MSEGLGVSIVDVGDNGMVAQLGSAIKQALSEQGNAVGVSSEWLGAKAVEAINEGLGGIDLLEMFGAAWTAVSSLRERADPAKYPPGKAHYVKLGEHTVNFDIKPKLVVSVGPWSSRPLELLMGLSAIIHAMELKIRSGHVESVCGGTCDIGVTMTFGGQEIMKRKTIKTLKLDVEHKFKAPGLSLSAERPAPAP